MSDKDQRTQTEGTEDTNTPPCHYDIYLTAEQCSCLVPHPLVAKYQRMSEAQYKVLRDDVALVGVKRPITTDKELRFAYEGIHRGRAACTCPRPGCCSGRT